MVIRADRYTGNSAISDDTSNVENGNDVAVELNEDPFDENFVNAEPIAEQNVESEVETNAEPIADNDWVRVVGLVLSNDVLDELNKFSEQTGKKINIIGLDVNNADEYKNKTTDDGEITFYNPLNAKEASNSYLMNFGDIDCISEEMFFLDDFFISDKLFNGTRNDVIYNSGDAPNMYYALAIKREVCFLFDMLSEESPLENESVRKTLLLNALEQYIIGIGNGSLHEKVDFDVNILNDYMRWVNALKENSKHAMKDRINIAQNDISNHYRALVAKDKELMEMNTLYSSLAKRLSGNKHDTDVECVTKMLKPLLKSGKFKKFEFLPMGVKAYTGNIQIVNFGKAYDIGEFLIDISLDGDLYMKNLTKKVGDLDHPHILKGRPCLGTVRNDIPTMLNNFNFLTLFDLLHHFLCSYNRGGIYPNGVVEKAWGDPDIDFCYNCDRPKLDCHCESRTLSCPECGSDMDNCTCERCPSSGALIMDGDICCDCEYCNDDGECRF